jgi:hypothetical protein
LRESRGVVRTRCVPTELDRRGDFSQTTLESSRGRFGDVLPIYDPKTSRQFPGNFSMTGSAMYTLLDLGHTLN